MYSNTTRQYITQVIKQNKETVHTWQYLYIYLQHLLCLLSKVTYVPLKHRHTHSNAHTKANTYQYTHTHMHIGTHSNPHMHACMHVCTFTHHTDTRCTYAHIQIHTDTPRIRLCAHTNNTHTPNVDICRQSKNKREHKETKTLMLTSSKNKKELKAQRNKNSYAHTKQEQKGAKSTKKQILWHCCCLFQCSWSFVSITTAPTTTARGISNLPLAQHPASSPACCWGWSQQRQGASLLSVGCRWPPWPPGSLTLHLPSQSVWSSPVCEEPEADCSHQLFQTILKTSEVRGTRNVFFNNR